VAKVAAGSGLPALRVEGLLAAQKAIDANTDLRLARYFRMSEGFFLGLQIDYDLEEERRTHGDELDRSAKRAA